jgi:hypothetical protein
LRGAATVFSRTSGLRRGPWATAPAPIAAPPLPTGDPAAGARLPAPAGVASSRGRAGRVVASVLWCWPRRSRAVTRSFPTGARRRSDRFAVLPLDSLSSTPPRTTFARRMTDEFIADAGARSARCA